MNAKIKLMALVAGLLSILPKTSAWASSYYANLCAKVSTNSLGMGKVYAAKTSTTAVGTYNESESTASDTKTNQSSQPKPTTMYAYAQANDGYEFVGWSAADNGSDLGVGDVSGNAYKKDFSVAYSDSSSATTIYYATFKKKLLDAFGITFETSDAGTYTVVGTLANSGAISGNGTIRKVSWLVSQSDVIKPCNSYNEYESFTFRDYGTYVAKYCKTTTANTPSVIGVTGSEVKWGVLLNGTKVYEISKQNPTALSVSFVASIVGELEAKLGWHPAPKKMGIEMYATHGFMLAAEEAAKRAA